jgi:hypothetical protein
MAAVLDPHRLAAVALNPLSLAVIAPVALEVCETLPAATLHALGFAMTALALGAGDALLPAALTLDMLATTLTLRPGQTLLTAGAALRLRLTMASATTAGLSLALTATLRSNLTLAATLCLGLATAAALNLRMAAVTALLGLCRSRCGNRHRCDTCC